jgi:hypothetical protein
MEGAVQATGRAGIPLYKSRLFELKSAVLVACSILPGLGGALVPALPGG